MNFMVILDNVYIKNDKFYLGDKKIKVIDKVKFICNDCGKSSSKEIRKFKYPLTDDSFICSPCARKRFYLKNFGVENVSQVTRVKEKRKETNLKKYGGNAPICSVEIKDKIKKTNLEKYGVENVFSNPEIKDKIKETNLEKYGVENPMFSPEVMEKNKKTAKKNFFDNLFARTNDLVAPLFTWEEYNNCASRREPAKWKCNICGLEFLDHLYSGRIPVCRKCNPIYLDNISKPEQELSEYIKGLGFEPFKFRRDRMEIDIFIPEKNIGFEFCGLYWHTEQKLASRKISPRLYHLNKLNIFSKEGIDLIQIFEDEWINKKEIVKERIRYKLGLFYKKIGGRLVIVKEIDTEIKKDFLNLYHAQGNDKSIVKLGAFFGKELVSVMTFSNLRIALGQKSIDGSYELTRFATKFGVKGQGIASKMFKYFIKNYKPKKIISYSDLRWNKGNLYKNLGFINEGRTSPNYFYVYANKRYNRFKFRKSELPKLLKIFDKDLSEYQNMLLNGYDRIWDCGHDKWVLKLA